MTHARAMTKGETRQRQRERERERERDYTIKGDTGPQSEKERQKELGYGGHMNMSFSRGLGKYFPEICHRI